MKNIPAGCLYMCLTVVEELRDMACALTTGKANILNDAAGPDVVNASGMIFLRVSSRDLFSAGDALVDLKRSTQVRISQVKTMIDSLYSRTYIRTHFTRQPPHLFARFHPAQVPGEVSLRMDLIDVSRWYGPCYENVSPWGEKPLKTGRGVISPKHCAKISSQTCIHHTYLWARLLIVPNSVD